LNLQVAEQAAHCVYSPACADQHWYPILKRGLDVVVAAAALIVLMPLFLVIAVAIYLDSPGPVLFRQQRVRGNWRPEMGPPEQRLFTFFKFRSMMPNADPRVHQEHVAEYINGNGKKQGATYKMRNDRRVTRVGRLLRRTSLDELPQLINVLRGDMSLVGPRPSMPYEVAQYKDGHYDRLTVTPGLTGLWQVSGRSQLTFEEMIRLDREYVRRRSLWLDLWILLKTVPAVVEGGGAC